MVRSQNRLQAIGIESLGSQSRLASAHLSKGQQLPSKLQRLSQQGMQLCTVAEVQGLWSALFLIAANAYFSLTCP